MLRLYQRGTVNVTNSSATVTGHDTRWLPVYVQPGDRFQVISDLVIGDQDIYTVQEVIDRRTVILTEAYRGSSAKGIAYQIDKINIADDAKLDRAKAEKIKAIKREANRKIIKVAPPWKQRNLLARGLELQNKTPAAWTAEEIAESEAIKAVWTAITAIRTNSDDLESQVETAATIAAVNKIN